MLGLSDSWQLVFTAVTLFTACHNKWQPCQQLLIFFIPSDAKMLQTMIHSCFLPEFLTALGKKKEWVPIEDENQDYCFIASI